MPSRYPEPAKVKAGGKTLYVMTPDRLRIYAKSRYGRFGVSVPGSEIYTPTTKSQIYYLIWLAKQQSPGKSFLIDPEYEARKRSLGETVPYYCPNTLVMGLVPHDFKGSEE